MHPSFRRPPPKQDDKTPVVLTYGPFTLRKTELGTWTLEAPASFATSDIDKLGALAQWAKQTTYDMEQFGVVLAGGPLGA